jgi:mannonate dehydratase
MNMPGKTAPHASNLLEESLRWFGPSDPVPLAYIRQAGATAVFSSLHSIPYGEPWPLQAIRQHREMIESHGLRWSVVESLPVHEDIKTGSGDLKTLFEHYRTSLTHLAAEGITTIIYNFMPVLDWVRTDMTHLMPDGSLGLLYDPVKFAAFEIHALQRRGAADGFTDDQVAAAGEWWDSLDDPARERFIQNIIDVFPGCKLGLGLDDIRAMLARYTGVDRDALTSNLARFLEAVAPTADALGIRLAIHPDDPPFPVLGLPRIVSTAADLDRILSLVDSPANGICFCSGSLGARRDNDVAEIARRFGGRIHAVHLRSTRLEDSGVFYEADHLDGDADMPALLSILLAEQDRRRSEGRADWKLPLRPDHGHTMMHDLDSYQPLTPGYSIIGRMRGLAELRGVMHGLRYEN